jgi:hypothetical protein
MALTDAYLIKTSNVDEFFNAIQAGQAPERFTYKFLEQLGFGSSNDRLYIKVLKELAFLDPSGVPTQRYFDFLDQSVSRAILAEAIAEAYSDLFTLNKKAYEMSEAEVSNKLRSLTQGKKSDNVIKQTAKTFKQLCKYADWEGLEKRQSSGANRPEELEEPETEDVQEEQTAIPPSGKPRTLAGGLHYNIQIHLPESRDPKVYDAIFEALKRHLD